MPKASFVELSQDLCEDCESDARSVKSAEVTAAARFSRGFRALPWIVAVVGAIAVALTVSRGGRPYEAPTGEYTKLVSEDMIKKAVTTGSEKLFEKLFKVAAPEGLGSLLWSHYEAPMAAFNGDGLKAVDSVSGAMTTVATGVFTSAAVEAGFAASTVAGPIGLVAASVAVMPAYTIAAFDSSKAYFSITFVNYAGYHVFLDGADYEGSQKGILDKTYFGSGFLSRKNLEKGESSSLYNECGFLIPGISFQQEQTSDDKVEVGSWMLPVDAKATAFTYSLRFIAKDTEIFPYHNDELTPEEKMAWWKDRSSVKRSWSIGVQAPKEGSWTASYYASIWAGDGNSAPDHNSAYDGMEKQATMGPDNGGFAGKSRAFWQDEKTLVVIFAAQ